MEVRCFRRISQRRADKASCNQERFMARTYYEVVLEGHLDTIFGLLEGVKIGPGKSGITISAKRST
jgi:hypothetical protein